MAVDLREDPNAALGGYTETIVIISSAQILAMGDNPIELLPPVGGDTYYDYYGIIEFVGENTGYTLEDDIVLGSYSTFGGCFIGANFLMGTSYKVFFFDNRNKGQESGVNAVQVGYYLPVNESISLFTYNSVNPAFGDGTLRVKIYHKTITFGA